MDRGKPEVHHIFYDDTAEQNAKMVTYKRPSSVNQRKKSTKVQTYQLEKNSAENTPSTTVGGHTLLNHPPRSKLSYFD